MDLSLLPENVRETIISLVPSSIANEIACFVFYDNHPAHKKICDIALCTKYGEVKEYYMSEEVSSLSLGSATNYSRMKILRNSSCQLFYLLSSGNELVILSRKEKLQVHHKVSNMEYYDIGDSVCRGQACLKVVLKDDAVPLIFDDNFENLGERAAALNGIHVDDSMPILIELNRKLTNGKYNLDCNEKSRKKFMELRKLTAFAASQKFHPNLEDAVFNEGFSEANDRLKLETQCPRVAICNQKVVIALNVNNKNQMPLRDVAILIHTNKPSIVCTTRLYQRTTKIPFWLEVSELQPNVDTAVTAIVDVNEIQYSRASRVEFNGVISYKKEDKEFLKPFGTVIISYLEFMGKKYDVLANDINNISILSVLATTIKLDLKLRIIGNAPEMTLPGMFAKYLGMEHVVGVDNAVIHKQSPHHILNGVMVIFENVRALSTSVEVYVRSNSQVLPLMHYIHEAIPHHIILTSHNHKITSRIDSLSHYNEEIPESVPLKVDYSLYAPTMLRQTAMILDYLDACIVKMNDSKDPEVKSMIGKKIDVFAGGAGLFKEDFGKYLLNEASKGILCLRQCALKPTVDSIQRSSQSGVKPGDSVSMILDTE